MEVCSIFKKKQHPLSSDYSRLLYCWRESDWSWIFPLDSAAAQIVSNHLSSNFFGKKLKDLFFSALQEVWVDQVLHLTSCGIIMQPVSNNCGSGWETIGLTSRSLFIYLLHRDNRQREYLLSTGCSILICSPDRLSGISTELSRSYCVRSDRSGAACSRGVTASTIHSNRNRMK